MRGDDRSSLRGEADRGRGAEVVPWAAEGHPRDPIDATCAASTAGDPSRPDDQRQRYTHVRRVSHIYDACIMLHDNNSYEVRHYSCTITPTSLHLHLIH